MIVFLLALLRRRIDNIYFTNSREIFLVPAEFHKFIINAVAVTTCVRAVIV